MDNFKAFQLTTEQAMKVTGQGHGKGKGKGNGLLKDLSKEDRKTVRTTIKGLRAEDGWKDLSKEDRRAAINGVIEPYLITEFTGDPITF